MWNLIQLIRFWNLLKEKFIKADPFVQIFQAALAVEEEVTAVEEEVQVEEDILVVDEVQEEVVIPEVEVPVHPAVITRKKIHDLIILINQVMRKRIHRIGLH